MRASLTGTKQNKTGGIGKMKKSMLRILLAALLIAGLLTSTALAATVEMAYSGGSLYLRTGPGRDYSANGTVHDGDYISVLSYGDIWSRVKTSSGRTGYIKNLYIDDGDDYYAAGTSYFSNRYSVYTTAGVNLRSGASTSTAVIKTLAKGTKLTAMGKNSGFYLVKTSDGTQGYISSRYLSESKVSGSVSSANTKEVTASYVNMRAGGGMSYDVLRVLPRGTEVTVLKVGNYWTRVNYKGTIGWIKNVYLK